MTITLADIIKYVNPCTKVVVYVGNKYIGACVIGLTLPSETFGDYMDCRISSLDIDEGSIRVDI